VEEGARGLPFRLQPAMSMWPKWGRCLAHGRIFGTMLSPLRPNSLCGQQLWIRYLQWICCSVKASFFLVFVFFVIER